MRLLLKSSNNRLYVLLGIAFSLVYQSSAVTSYQLTETQDSKYLSKAGKFCVGSLVHTSELAQGTVGISRMPPQVRRDSGLLTHDAIENKLDKLQNILKGFIQDQTFDFIAFEKRAALLIAQLLELERIVMVLLPGVARFFDTFNFTKLVFESMQEAIPKLKFFRKNGGRDQVLVHDLIQMNILLWKIYDSTGLPDTKSPEFSNTLHRISMDLKAHNHVYHSLSNVPLIVQLEFTRQRNSVTRKLRTLVSMRNF